MRKALQRMKDADPMRGKWSPSLKRGEHLVCIASSLAMGSVRHGDRYGTMVEGAAWHRGKRDCEHINAAELISVNKVLNLWRWYGEQRRRRYVRNHLFFYCGCLFEVRSRTVANDQDERHFRDGSKEMIGNNRKIGIGYEIQLIWLEFLGWVQKVMGASAAGAAWCSSNHRYCSLVLRRV